MPAVIATWNLYLATWWGQKWLQSPERIDQQEHQRISRLNPKLTRLSQMSRRPRATVQWQPIAVEW